MDNSIKDKSNLMKMVGVLIIFVCIYVIALIITEIKNYRFIGGGAPATNVIAFDGKGEVFAKPDIATVSFTLRDNQKELKDAQDKVTAKETAVLAFLEKSGIEEKDIKTENYSSYPKYDSGAPCYYGVCPVREAKIIGYEVSEYITVKVRDLTKAGEIVRGVGEIGVSDMSGPNFAIDNEDELKAEARKLAIEDAKEKAEQLSRDLGVRLVRIVNFSENGNYAFPYATKAGNLAEDAVQSVAAPTPNLPTGENKITSNVSITYEIR